MPCLAVAHTNHWADITANISTQQPPDPIWACTNSNNRIRSPLYDSPFIFYYGLYPIDSSVSTFLQNLYQAELLAQLETKLEIERYVYHTHELETLNLVIGYTVPIRRLLTHQPTSWKQHHLYKSQTSCILVAQVNHPHEKIKPTLSSAP